MPRLTEEKVRKILGDFIDFNSEVMKRPSVSNFIINNALRFFNEVPKDQRTIPNFKRELLNKSASGGSGYKTDPTWLDQIIDSSKKSKSESFDNVIKDIFDESEDAVRGYTPEEINNKFKDYGLPPMKDWTAQNGLLSGVVSGRTDVSPRIIDYFNNTDNPTIEGLLGSFGSGTAPTKRKIEQSLAAKGRTVNDFDKDISLMRAGSRDERAELRKQRETLAAEEEKKKADRILRAEARKKETERLAKVAEMKSAEDARNPIDTSTPEGAAAEAARDKAIFENISMKDTLREDLKRAEENQAKRRAAEKSAREANERTAGLKRDNPGLTAEQIRDLETKISAGEATATQNLPAFHQEALKGLYKGAVQDVFNRQYEPYRGERFAQETPLQVIAKGKLLELDPFLGETKANQQSIIDKIKALNQDPAKNAIREYLMPSTQTLGQTHEDLLGADERAAEDIYRRRGMEHLMENVVPSIRNKYSPSSHIHGSRDRELTKAIRNYGRETEDALAGMRLKNKAITIPAALQHQEQRIKSGQALSNSAISDAQHNMAAIEGLQKAQDETVKSKEKFINSIHGAGQAEQAREQQKNDLAYERFKEERDQGVSNIERFSNIIRGHNLPKSTTQTNLMPPKFVQSPWSAAGDLATGIGASNMPQRAYKKGGTVQKAIGGAISPIQEAINWSVIDKESPIDEMKRNIRRERALGMMGHLRNTRQMYADGGSISPIEKGAMTADNVAYMDRIKRSRENMMNQNMRDQVFERQPFLTDALQSGAHAVAANTENPYGNMMISSGLHSALRGASNVFDRKDREREAFQKQRQGALDRDVNLLKDEENIVRDARDFGFKEKRFGEEMDFEKKKFEDQMALQKLIQSSNDRHHRAQEDYWMNKDKGVSGSSLSPEKTDALKSELKAKLDKAIYKRNTARNLYNAAESVPTGRWIGKAASIPLIGHPLASLMSLADQPSSPSEYQALDDASEEYFSARTPEKGRETNLQAANRRKAKAGLDKGKTYNLRQSKEEELNSQSDVNAILEQYAKYASPKEISEYSDEYKPIDRQKDKSMDNTSSVFDQKFGGDRNAMEARRQEILRKKGLA